MILGKSRDWINDKAFNEWDYGVLSEDKPDEELRFRSMPFIDYVLEDKSKYPFIDTVRNDKLSIKGTSVNYIDTDRDFRVGNSGGLLMNIDFIFVNTAIFSKTSDYHDKHGKYCPYEEGSAKYTKFWRTETERRKKGVSAKCKVYHKDIDEYFNENTTENRKSELRHYVRITGSHYNYLNYGRIERTPTADERKELDKQGLIATNTLPGFPRFWDADYWYFKTDEFIIKNKKNLVLAKARRKGISYKRGSQSANTVNLNKSVTVVLAADILDYLIEKEAIADMAKKNLNWYETETYWKRGFLSEALDSIELGYKRSKEGNKKYGHQSKILSVAIGRNESAAIGKKGIDIDFEESGKSPNLQNAWSVTLSNIESGAIKIGTGRIYGTAGTKGANWASFSNIFYNCDANNMVAFENVWNYNARHTTCGFFIAQVWCCEPYIYDGNSLFLDAWEWDKNDKDSQRVTAKPQDYVIYVAQRANSPAEAFIDTKDNLFTSPILNDHIQWLYDSPDSKYYTDGWYTAKESVRFLNKEQCIKERIFNGQFHEYITDVPHTDNTDVHGCVREYMPPFIVDGEIPPDLYFLTVDTYRVDKNKDQVGIKNSLYSIQCWMRSNTHTPYDGKRLVAEYCGRLDTMAENDMITLNMSRRYNCGVLPEAGTGDLINNFRVWGWIKKIMRDPSAITDNRTGSKTLAPLGCVVGDTEKKLEGLRELYEYIYEVVGKTSDGSKIYRINQIPSLALCLELQRYSLNGNFDRVSSAIVAMFQFKKDFVQLKDEIAKGSNVPKPKEKRLSNILKKRYVR